MNDGFIIIRAEIFFLCKHVVDTGKYHTCNGNDGLLLAPPFGKPLVFDGKVRIFFTFDSGEGTLD